MITYDAHLAALRHDCEGLASAARDALERPVPSCPDWTVAGLLAHVGHGFRWVTRIVRDHADAEVPYGTVDAPGDDVVAWYEGTVAELVEALSNEAPESRAWNWSGRDETVAFWARRMAHEVAVHRWDAENACGDPSPIDPERAADGVDEMLDVYLPVSLGEEPVDDLAGTLAVEATDTGDTWLVTLRPDSSEVTRGAAPAGADATLRGPASDLLLRLWGRPVAVESSGDERIVAVFTQ